MQVAENRSVEVTSPLWMVVCAVLSLLVAVLVCIVTLAGGVGGDDDDAIKTEVECPVQEAPPPPSSSLPSGPVYPAPSLEEIGVPCEENFTATGKSIGYRAQERAAGCTQPLGVRLLKGQTATP